MSEAKLKIAVVGSGPAGLYLVEKLGKTKGVEMEVDVLDRLSTPFGLIRSGIAPDHQGTKGVARVLDRGFSKNVAQFWGNVEVGKDVSLEQLRASYDAVVLAVGAAKDRAMNLPGEDLKNVFGSAQFVGWYNRHPDWTDLPVDLSQVKSVAVIGAGNVAIDVARVLAKTPGEMVGSDLDPGLTSLIAAAPIETIHVIARRGPEDAKFTAPELGEMTRLEAASAKTSAEDFGPAGESENSVYDLLQGMASAVEDKARKVQFHFNLQGHSLAGDGTVASMTFAHAGTGDEVQIPADLVVSCIGYETVPCDDMAPEGGKFENTDGQIADGLYVTGWAKRGPSGTVATNRAEAHAVADKLVAEVSAGDRLGRAALEKILQDNAVSYVTYQDWQKIDEAEKAAAPEDRVRLKGAGV